MTTQPPLINNLDSLTDYRKKVSADPLRFQLLKWIGNKQRFAPEIISHFPARIGRYWEPFLGSGAVLATLAWKESIGSDVFKPLIDIFLTLQNNPGLLKDWYSRRWEKLNEGSKKEVYEHVRNSYNANPNAADLVFISRACYGGVVRFTKGKGFISTPVGIHDPINPDSFGRRVDIWNKRVKDAVFINSSFEEVMPKAEKDDLVYCDPPYYNTQSILYGAQSFDLRKLFDAVKSCKDRGVYVALSIDGTKRSGNLLCDVPIPAGLFETEVFINTGKSMLKRFQMNGDTLDGEVVKDRLLLTYSV
jgi:DNA adenine methylase